MQKPTDSKNIVTSMRLPQPTRNQIDELAALWNVSIANIVTIAIDRMYREETKTMTTETATLTIGRINTKPEHDPYTNIDGILSRTYLKLDPRDRTVWVTQEYNDNSTPSDEWHGLVLTWLVPDHPMESDMREWIEEHMPQLARICAGYESVWNGSNHVGELSDDARAVKEAIEFELDNGLGPVNYYETWTVESWLESSLNEITADTTDEELAGMIDNWQPDSSTIVTGDMLQYATQHRDNLRSEREYEQE